MSFLCFRIEYLRFLLKFRFSDFQCARSGNLYTTCILIIFGEEFKLWSSEFGKACPKRCTININKFNTLVSISERMTAWFLRPMEYETACYRDNFSLKELILSKYPQFVISDQGPG